MLKFHIQTIQASSGAVSDFTFSNIPQIYDDLELKISYRFTHSNNAWYDANMRFNGSANNYTQRILFGNGSSPSSITETGGINIRQSDASNTANTFGSGVAIISNYTRAVSKTVSVDTVSENASTTAFQAIQAGIWADNSAITSISFAPVNGTTFTQHSSISLYGIKRGADGVTVSSPVATGGTVTASGGFTYHTFTGSGTFAVNRNLSVDALIVGGGGGGGGNAAGGGGAGGYIAQSMNLTPATYTVTVGSGGVRGTGNNNDATSGNISSAFGFGAIGGGRGAGNNTVGPASADSGGSGGGGSANNNAGGSGTSGQGFAGGTGIFVPSPQVLSGGGGGGAGSAGANHSTSPNAGGAGGAGLTWLNGSSYAGGGGGGRSVSGTTTAAPGGIGGGGAGGYDSASPNSGVDAIAGTANTGGGGGGAAWGSDENGGNGGSGVVIIRYRTPA